MKRPALALTIACLLAPDAAAVWAKTCWDSAAERFEARCELDTRLNLGKAPRHLTGSLGQAPIHPVTGNLYWSDTDFSVATPGYRLSFERSYNSQDDVDRGLGVGWSCPFDAVVAELDLGLIELTRGDGRREQFARTAAGWTSSPQSRFRPAPGAPDPVHYRLLSPRGDEWLFSRADGRLIRILAHSGWSVEIERSGDLLAAVTVKGSADFVRTVTFSSDGRHLLEATLPSGRKWLYRYDPSGRLVAVDHRQGSHRKYLYGDINQVQGKEIRLDGGGDPSNLVAVGQGPTRTLALVSYDARDRATFFRRGFGPGESVAGHHRIAWDSPRAGRVTVSLGDRPVRTQTLVQDVIAGLGVIREVTGDPCSACGNDTQRRRTFDQRANPVRVEAADGAVIRMAYDAHDRPVEATETRSRDGGIPKTRRSRSSYHSRSGALTRIRVEGSSGAEEAACSGNADELRFEYDPLGRLLLSRAKTVCDNSGHSAHLRTRRTYSAEGLLERSDGPLAGSDDTRRFEYFDPAHSDFPLHLRRALTGPLDKPRVLFTVDAYDRDGRPIEYRNGAGTLFEERWDDAGRLGSRRAILGADDRQSDEHDDLVWTFRYEGERRTSVVTPSGRSRVYAYADTGRLPALVETRGGYPQRTGGALALELDALSVLRGLRLRRLDGPGESALWASVESEERADVVQLGDPADAQGSGAVRVEYDSVGNVSAVEQVGGEDRVRVEIGRDELGEVECTSGSWVAGGREVCARRNDLGRTLSLFTGDADIYRARYSSGGRLTSLSFPGLGESVRFVYDDDSGAVHVHYPRTGESITREADFLGRPTRIVTSGPLGVETESFSYDVAGASGSPWQVGTLDSGWLRSTFGYLPVYGYLAEDRTTIDGLELHTAWEHDADGRLRGIEFPTGRRSAYSRSADGETAVDIRLSPPRPRVSSPAAALPLVTDIRWFAGGQILGFEAESGGVRVGYRFGSDGRRRQARFDTRATTRGFGFAYTAGSRLVQGVRHGFQVGFRYDRLGRHVETTNPSGARVESVVYGSTGLPERIETRLGAAVVRYHNQNPVSLAYGQRSAFRIGADARGRLTSFTSGANKVSYRYDPKGQVRQVLDERGRLLARLDYDPWRRLRRIAYASGRTLHVAYDRRGRPLSVLSVSASGGEIVARDYVWLAGELLSVVVSKRTAGAEQFRDVERYYYLSDAVGRPLAAVDRSGELVWESTCDSWLRGCLAEPFGATAPNPLWFARMLLIPDLGLPRAEAEGARGDLLSVGGRLYMPEGGFFLQGDRALPVAGHTFAGLDPVNNHDASGAAPAGYTDCFSRMPALNTAPPGADDLVPDGPMDFQNQDDVTETGQDDNPCAESGLSGWSGSSQDYQFLGCAHESIDRYTTSLDDIHDYPLWAENAVGGVGASKIIAALDDVVYECVSNNYMDNKLCAQLQGCVPGGAPLWAWSPYPPNATFMYIVSRTRGLERYIRGSILFHEHTHGQLDYQDEDAAVEAQVAWLLSSPFGAVPIIVIALLLAALFALLAGASGA